MRNRTLLFLLLITMACAKKAPEVAPLEAASNQEVYDSTLAHELGADDYGMKTYVMAFLKRGPNRDLPAEEAQALQMAHLKIQKTGITE